VRQRVRADDCQPGGECPLPWSPKQARDAGFNRKLYDPDAPEGVWTAVFDASIWGGSTHGLHCYFTFRETGRRHWFFFHKYDSARNGQKAVRYLLPGTVLKLTIGLTRNDQPKVCSYQVLYDPAASTDLS
jgi:hypothetical protein